MEFDFEIQHRRRKKYVAANMLSRMPTAHLSESNIGGNILVYKNNDFYIIAVSTVEVLV